MSVKFDKGENFNENNKNEKFTKNMNVFYYLLSLRETSEIFFKSL